MATGIGRELLDDVAAPFGRTVDDMGGAEGVAEWVGGAVRRREGTTAAALEGELAEARREFQRRGGRGVGVADEIDEVLLVRFLLRRAKADTVGPEILG